VSLLTKQFGIDTNNKCDAQNAKMGGEGFLQMQCELKNRHATIIIRAADVGAKTCV